MSKQPMKRVTGIGGIFFKAKDPAALSGWYRDHLGLEINDWNMTTFSWGGEGSLPGSTVWSIFAADTSYMEPGTAPFMINFRVEELSGLLQALKAEGCQVADQIEVTEHGKFGWVVDPEGNKIELWEPPAEP